MLVTAHRIRIQQHFEEISWITRDGRFVVRYPSLIRLLENLSAKIARGIQFYLHPRVGRHQCTETWAIKESQLACLERFHNRCVHVFSKIFFATHGKVYNTTIRHKAEGQLTTERLIRTRRLRWFGRAYRMHPSCLQTRCSQLFLSFFL